MKRSAMLPILGIVLVLVAVQLAVSAADKNFYLVQLTMAAYYTVVALGLCLVMGYAGQISLGHGAFFAIGGYLSAILTTRPLTPVGDSGIGHALLRAGILGMRENLYGDTITTATPWAAFVAAMIVAALVALLIGYPALRLKGHYLAMATLGFGLIIYRLVLGSDITGAADGIQGVPPWALLPGVTVSGRKAYRVENYYVASGLAIVVLLLLLNLVRSRVGRAFRSIHEGEQAANAMGINTAGYKLKAFVISAVLAAAAGSLMTHYNGGIGPSEAGAMKSVRYVALVAGGGMANLWGVLLVSTLINFLSLRGFFGSFDHAVFGTILIAIVSLAPEGPLQPIGRWLRGVSRGLRPAGARRKAHGAA